MTQRVSYFRNVRIWGSYNPHAIYEHERDSPKVNVFRVVSSSNVFGPFVFAEKTVTGFIYLDMLQIYLMPILKERMHESLIWQQNGAPCHFHNEVTSYLNAEERVWIGRGGVSPWPSRSPDLIPLDFSIWTRFIMRHVRNPSRN
ncbi:hypothetical protein AVEN_17724-1 [Araneus ventricosus]|uniref:Tc1-like transposase DDE domain-containing protein n=1 Tax=Araneus ventricosus TaxID=182803 RepID=A0A4Y2FD73_ARAVE|nr:hypothetical protein AVEN_17724-1 [Araneus ventricosus]